MKNTPEIARVGSTNGSALKRPEWITCIRHTHAEKTAQTWCGRNAAGFSFRDIDHAAYNALDGGRLVACPECVVAIMAALFPNNPVRHEGAQPRSCL